MSKQKLKILWRICFMKELQLKMEEIFIADSASCDWESNNRKRQ